MARDVKTERQSAIRASKALSGRMSKLIDEELEKDLKDVAQEEEKVSGGHSSSDALPSSAHISGEDHDFSHDIVVTKLQCWKSLSKQDIGPYNQHSVIRNQGWGKLGLYSVKGVSFCVKQGERFVILGSASSGRTSMIKNILGLERILTGEIEIAGISSKELYQNPSMIHGLIGYQPQIDSLAKNFTVKQHLEVFARLAGVQKRFI